MDNGIVYGRGVEVSASSFSSGSVKQSVSVHSSVQDGEEDTNSLLSAENAQVYAGSASASAPATDGRADESSTIWKKTFVLDTNVLLHDPDAIKAFKHSVVCIPLPCISDLNSFKKKPGEIGSNARQVIRMLEDLRKVGSLNSGVPLDNGSVVRILTQNEDYSFTSTPDHSTASDASEKVLQYAFRLNQAASRLGGPRATLVSKDMVQRLRADALQIPVVDYLKQRISLNTITSGWMNLSCPAEIAEAVEACTPPHPGQSAKVQDVDAAKLGLSEYAPNQFVVLEPEAPPPPQMLEPHEEEKEGEGEGERPSSPVASADEVQTSRQRSGPGSHGDVSPVAADKGAASDDEDDDASSQSSDGTIATERRRGMKPEGRHSLGGDEHSQPLRPIVARIKDRGLLTAENLPARAWNIVPRSVQQAMALQLLLDPQVSVVTLIGRAGTGKTLLALAAGLEMSIHHKAYSRVLVTRPVLPLGHDIGYLPGSKDEKMTHWMAPIFDNLSAMTRQADESLGIQNNPFGALRKEENPHSQIGAKGSKKNKKKAKKHQGDPGVSQGTAESDEEQMRFGVGEEVAVQHSVDKLLRQKVSLEAITYIRGRSIQDEYVIVDEAQNLTPHEVKTIISRAGEGTKIILAGDPQQIDNPYLDITSNGLTYAVDRLRSSSIHGHITLHATVRSALAALAAEVL